MKTHLNNESETQAVGSELSAGLGGVLTYRCGGRKRGIGGQTVGADGAGEFAMLIRGTPAKAEEYSRAYIKEMESLGYKIEEVIFVHNGDDYGYFGNPTRMVDA